MGDYIDDLTAPDEQLSIQSLNNRANASDSAISTPGHAPHQRKGGTLHPHRPPRMGLRPRLPHVTPARHPPDALAASIQLASATWQPQPPASY